MTPQIRIQREKKIKWVVSNDDSSGKKFLRFSGKNPCLIEISVYSRVDFEKQNLEELPERIFVGYKGLVHVMEIIEWTNGAPIRENETVERYEERQHGFMKAAAFWWKNYLINQENEKN
jgi:hypothetical protein